MMPQPALHPDGVQGSETLDVCSLVERIRAGDPAGMEELYRVFSRGVRFHLCRQLGPQDLDDRVHDIFLIITQSIRNGDLRDPERLMGYVRTIMRRQVAAHIDDAVQARRSRADVGPEFTPSDREPDPESQAIAEQNTELAMRILRSIPSRDREVLVRFYLEEQPARQICEELHLTETQFRLIKSRAKARFGELGKARMAQRSGFLFHNIRLRGSKKK
jgi:RNA polymerase sigma-70 factor, ECF subfamily